MKHPNELKRVSDGRIFRITYVAFLDPRKSRYQSEFDIDDLTWVSDTFFVSGSTGHTYVPV